MGGGEDDVKGKPSSSSGSGNKDAPGADSPKVGKALDAEDIPLLKAYGVGTYAKAIKGVEADIARVSTHILELSGVKESDTGLAPPSTWDVVADKMMMENDQPLLIARCTKIIPGTEESPGSKYVINAKHQGKFVVDLDRFVSPTDIEEDMRVGVERKKYQIKVPLQPKIDASVTMMTVEERPNVTYADVGGCKDQIEELREVGEYPLLS